MGGREVITLTLCLLSLFWMLSTNASTSESNRSEVKNIAIFKTMDLALIDNAIIEYQKQLTTMVPESITLNFVQYNAFGNRKIANDVVADLVQRQAEYDLIISVATLSTNAMVSRGNEWVTPTQFMIVSDPVNANIVEKLGETSWMNMTGTSHVIAADTKLELVNLLLKHNTTKIKPTIGLLFSDYPSSIASAEYLLKQQTNYEYVQFIPIKYEFLSGNNAKHNNHKNIIRALTRYQSQIDGYWITPGPAAHDKTLYATIQDALSLPQLFSEDLTNIEQGALFGVMSDAAIIGRIAAAESNIILGGTPASVLPVNRSDAFIVALNLATSLRLKMVIPSDLLRLATNHTYGL